MQSKTKTEQFHVTPYLEFPFEPLTWEDQPGWTLNDLPVWHGSKEEVLIEAATVFSETDVVIWSARPSQVANAERYTVVGGQVVKQQWTIQDHQPEQQKGSVNHA